MLELSLSVLALASPCNYLPYKGTINQGLRAYKYPRSNSLYRGRGRDVIYSAAITSGELETAN